MHVAVHLVGIEPDYQGLRGPSVNLNLGVWGAWGESNPPYPHSQCGTLNLSDTSTKTSLARGLTGVKHVKLENPDKQSNY